MPSEPDDDRPARARRRPAPEPTPMPDDAWDEVNDDEPVKPRPRTRQRPRRRDAEVLPTPYVKWVAIGTGAAVLFVGVVIGAAALLLRPAAQPAGGEPTRKLEPFAPPADLPAAPPATEAPATGVGSPLAASPVASATPPRWPLEAAPGVVEPAPAPLPPGVDPLPEFAWPTPAGAPGSRTRLVKADAFPAGGNAVEIAVAGGFLFARNSGSTVRAFDLASKKLAGTAEAQHKFISLSGSPDGKAVFAADYGGEQTGYGHAIGVHRLHRFDLAAKKWESRPAPGVVGYIRAVAADRVVMTDLDQWVEMRLTLWEPGTARLRDLGKSGGYRSGYIDYDPASRRVFHTGFELSSCKVEPGALGAATNAGASKGGGSLVVAHGGARLYQGPNQFELADPSRGTNSFKEAIVAATRDLALAAGGNYYDAATGKLAGRLPFAPDGSAPNAEPKFQGYEVGASGVAPVAVSPDGMSVWAYDPKADEFVRFDCAEPTKVDAAVKPAATEPPVPETAPEKPAMAAGPRPVPFGEFRWPEVPGPAGSQTRVTRGGNAKVWADPGKSPPAEARPVKPGARKAPAPKPPGDVAQVVVAPGGKTLFLRGSAGPIRVLEAGGGKPTLRAATNTFLDMSLSPDGKFLFATDSSGEVIGAKKPKGTD